MFDLLLTRITNIRRRWIQRGDRSLQPNPRPHIHQTTRCSQRSCTAGISNAPNHYRCIPTPNFSSINGVDSPESLACPTAPLLSGFPRILSYHRHGPDDVVCGRCVWSLLCVRSDCCAYCKVSYGYVLALGGHAFGRQSWVRLGLHGFGGIMYGLDADTSHCHEIWAKVAATLSLYAGYMKADLVKEEFWKEI